MVRIVTGISESGGSTIAHVNLCNFLNANGYKCILYGPNEWHLDKCPSGSSKNVPLMPEDILVWHYFAPPAQHPPCRMLVLSLHEKHGYQFGKVNYKVFDKIHYVSESQRLWHNVEHPYFVCGNLLDELKPNRKTCSIPTAGVIGSIDPNKRTEMSIRRAIDDGFKDIRLYGKLAPAFMGYYEANVKPLIKKHYPIVKDIILFEDKQAMYDSVTDVYLSSVSEVRSNLIGECKLTGTRFHGISGFDCDYALITNEEILRLWRENVLDAINI